LNTNNLLTKKQAALVGAGYIFDAHAKALKHSTVGSLSAVVDVSASAAKNAADRFGVPHQCTTIEEAVRKGVNVAHILTPADKHFDPVRISLEQGLNVLCEKPFVLSSDEALKLFDLAESKGLLLGVNHNFLFSSAYEKLRTDLHEGFFGPLQHIEVTWAFPLGQLVNGPFGGWLTEKPGNIFLELGAHLIAFGVDLLPGFKLHRVDPFDHIVLPNGRVIFRQWHISGYRDTTRIDFFLSTRPQSADRSLRVRGLAASAECLYDRNTYTTSELRSLNPLFDDFIDQSKRATSIAKQTGKNLVSSLLGSLKKSPDANAYGSSFKYSVDAFYKALSRTDALDDRFSKSFALEVVKHCEKIAFESNESEQNIREGTFATAPDPLPTVGLKEKIVLVTGATGFIGKVLVHRLIEAGYSVRITSRSKAAAESAFKGVPVEVAVGSLGNKAFLENALAGVSTVYHLAKGDGKRWGDYLANDVEPTLLLAESALSAKVERFIFAGTIDSYYSGNPNDVISGSTLLDTSPRRNHYARSKAVIEAGLLKLHAEKRLPLIILRPGIVIGKGFSPAHWGVGMFLSNSNMAFWGDGLHHLPFILVDDVADGLFKAINAPNLFGKTLLLTDAPLLTGRGYVAALEGATQTKIRSKNGPAWNSFAIDVFKETLKHLIHHPNRRIPSYRDWLSRQHRARYDSAESQSLLGWKPCGDRELMIEKGINTPARDLLR
jgi:nucleoside-diphosphate-sugar epimerase